MENLRQRNARTDLVIVLGVVLLLLGLFLAVHILYVLGIVLLVVGVLLAVFGNAGYPVAGRRHYY